MTEAKQEMKIGDEMEDGTIYAGISPDTGRAMYTTPEDAPLKYMYRQAAKYAANLNAHGHDDWRVTTKPELLELFNNSAAIGGFHEKTSAIDFHWTSTRFGLPGIFTKYAYQMLGRSMWHGGGINTGYELSLRCVRG
jgi:hypothetical protein